ncbi:hypothetical protein MANES_18G036550v8, partial [Manihot esculenta]
MKLLSWNCQGLGNPLTIRHLRGMCASHSPDLLFVMETKNSDHFVRKKLQLCGFVNMLFVSPIGRSGGLLVAWRDHLNFTIEKYTSFLVHVTISYQLINKTWSALFCYFSCLDIICIEQFKFLLDYHHNLREAILLVGDFNCVLNYWEKKGGNVVNWNVVDSFRFLINSLGLTDLGFRGPIFTWNNHRDGSLNIQERLDRSLASINWIHLYSSAVVEHLEDWGSDHRPLLVNISPSMPKAKRLFSFDAHWISKLETFRIIEQAWS